MAQDQELSDVGAVIFDEFHERSLDSDMALALVLDLHHLARPDLRYSLQMDSLLRIRRSRGPVWCVLGSCMTHQCWSCNCHCNAGLQTVSVCTALGVSVG